MKRLFFSVLLFLGLLVGLAASAQVKTTGKPVIKGTVSDTEGRPLSGVIVTDGFTHSETNKAGRFRIVSPHPERVRFVSARIPSGYRPILKDGRTEFFAPVEEYTGKTRKARILLEKDSAPSDSYTVFMIADPQANPYRKEYRSENFAYATTDIWMDMFTDMKSRISNTSGPCYGICLGDIAAAGGADIPYADVYKDYLQGMKVVNIPFFQVAGNHDHHFNTGANDDDEAVKPFEDAFGPRNYSFDLGKVHYVVLDDCIYIKGLRRYPMKYGLEDDFLEWLKSDLAKVPKDMPVMICSHADLFNSEGVQDWVYENIKSAYKLPEVLAALQGFEKLYFWAGHIHVCSFVGKVNSPDNPSGIEIFAIGRSSGGLGNEYVGVDGTPRGYVVMEVNGKEFSWKYHPISTVNAPFRGKKAPSFQWHSDNMDETFQMRVYPRGAYNDDFVYANIFLWDPSWSVPILRIGDKTYPMKQDYLYDLSYKEVVQFYNKTANANSSYSPGNKNHHFLVRVPEDARGTGKVEVTDRFGNKWVSEVSVDPVVYRDNRLHLSFDLREKDALAISEHNGYSLIISGGEYVAASDSEEGYWDLSKEGSSLTLPSIPGYSLTSVTVHPSGNTKRSQSAQIETVEGKTVHGGEPLIFLGNATDTWELQGTSPGESYRILAPSGAFHISEIRLSYEKCLQ